MEKYLIESGFIQGEFPNEFTYGSWTIRLFSDLLEVYDGIEQGESGAYWIGEKTWENLILLVEGVLDNVDGKLDDEIE